MELSLVIDQNPETPLFLRLAAAIRETIMAQRLVPGQKIPSAQELADSLSISRPTVVKTYKALISEGYLEAITGSGTFVTRKLFSPAEQSHESTRATTRNIPLDSLSKYARRIIDIDCAEATMAGQPELNFGSPPLDPLPREKWREILIKYCRVRPPNQFECANEVFGYRPLRSAIASYLMRSKGVKCSADQVIIFDGSHAFSHVARLLIEPGDTVVVENPGYIGARENLLAEGAQLLPAEVDDEGLLVEPLRRQNIKAKLCYVTCAHQDPTGAVMSLERRQELLAWASRNCAFIVEDGFDSDYHHGMPNMPALQSFDRDGKVLYIYSFWKVLAPLVSLGVLVVPNHLIPLFEKAKFLTDRQFPSIEHYALAEIISDGHIDLHVKRTGKIYQTRRQKLIYALTQSFRERVSVPRYSGGLHTLVHFKLNRKSDELLKLAAEAGLPMASTAPFYFGDAKPGEFLIPFSTMLEDEIEEIVQRFARKTLVNPY